MQRLSGMHYMQASFPKRQIDMHVHMSACLPLGMLLWKATPGAGI